MSLWSRLFAVRNLALALALVLVGLGCAPAPSPVHVSTEPASRDRTITVSGSARLEVVPDEACIEMTLVGRDAAMPKAHQRLREGVGPLLAELKKIPGLVVEEGPTRYAPEYESDGHGGAARLVRHAASAQINVRTSDFGRIPDIVGRAASQGLDRVEVVLYSTTMVARKAELRARALELAQQKAQAMATALGVSLGEVVTITEGEARSSAAVGVTNYLDRGNVDAAPDAPAPPGAIPLFTSVGVVYRVK